MYKLFEIVVSWILFLKYLSIVFFVDGLKFMFIFSDKLEYVIFDVKINRIFFWILEYLNMLIGIDVFLKK